MEKFNFNRDFFEACEALGEEDGKDMAWAILNYVYHGEEPKLEGPLMAVFLMGKGRFDAAVDGYNSAKKGKTTSKTPAEPPYQGGTEGATQPPYQGGTEGATQPPYQGGTEGATQPPYQGGTEEKPEPPCQENKKEYKSKEALPNGSAKKARSRFRPPSPAEVREYARSNGLNLDPDRFCDYYAANGWKVGRSEMRDWKATARNWSRSESKQTDEGKEVADAVLDELAPYL